MAGNSLGNILQFLELMGQLKHTPRTGWVHRQIPNPESIASHMYRMAIMTFLLGEKDNINRSRCMELALVHDMAECIVGDITPNCGIPREEKHRRENEAMKHLVTLTGNHGDYMYQLYKEYEKQETVESKLVKELDMFDMILQAYEYEKQVGTPLKLQEFFDSTKHKFKQPIIESLVNELNTQRNVYSKEHR
uniref:5'-deoxynucleotidase HDDC2 n=2 Tax=Clastoptera arizonana TaxID=38151 RepID=A0A1B6CYP5_9HEMI